MINKLSVYDVFTPSTPAKETFIERELVTNRLVDALRTPGKQIILYGHSGSGKSTLIERKLYQLYENHITTQCIKGMTFESVLMDAFDQLDPYFASLKVQGNEEKLSIEMTASWTKVAAARSSVTKLESTRVLPPQLTVQNLARFAGYAKACWVLEDFHKLEEEEKVKLAQAMKMFMDMSKTYPDIKSVAVGAVGSAREVVQYDNEMRNRVAEIEVKLMEADELRQIIDVGTAKLNVSFTEETSRAIVDFSSGMASICHQLCLNMCVAANITESTVNRVPIDAKFFKIAVREYVESASDSIRSRFDKACRIRRKRKYDNYGTILRNLSAFEIEGATVGELTETIARTEETYNSNNLARYLKSLQTDDRGAIVVYDSASGKYRFSDPFVRSYAQAAFEMRKKADRADSTMQHDVNDAMLRYLQEMVVRKSHHWAESAGPISTSVFNLTYYDFEK